MMGTLIKVKWPSIKTKKESEMNIKSLVLLTLLAFVVSGFAQAAPPAKGKMGMAMEEPSKEDRAKMATMHEQMAACLKSDKKFSECHDEMMKSCPMMKSGKCPMMMHQGDKGNH
jgi:hypothetical protein